MSEPVISLQSLGKRLRDTIAVAGLSLEIEAGEIFAFLGANGAGKTTTIRMLCGLTKPTQGRGFIKGFNIWKDRFRIRSLFGYVPQRFSLYGDLTVLETSAFLAVHMAFPSATYESELKPLLRILVSRQRRTPARGDCREDLSNCFRSRAP